MKQDECKIGFFDLPAEIRILIYESFCQSLLSHFNLPDGRLPVGAPEIWPEYSDLLLKAQLMCHQLREELVPVWARCTTFVLEHQYPGARIQELSDVWIRVRDFLDWIGPIARHEVRIVHVSCICSRTRVKWGATTWMPYPRIVRSSTGQYLASAFERLSDIHDDVTFEVEVRGEDHYFHAALVRGRRRVFTLRQQARGRGKQKDWTCSVAPREKITMKRDVTPSQSPNRQDWRDELWKAGKRK